MAADCEPRVIQLLEQVNWNFPGSSTSEKTVHSLHWFPGNFIPQIPSYLIQILSQKGDRVLDPFCGAGTTGVEAVRLGRNSWQSDVNRASIQVAQGKMAAAFDPTIRSQLEALFQELIWENILHSDSKGKQGEGSNPELSIWFHADTLSQLRYLWSLVEASENPNFRSVLELLFSDTLFACASGSEVKTKSGGVRRHHWGWVADNVRPRPPMPHNAIKIFKSRVLRAAELIPLHKELSCNDDYIRREDIRNLGCPDESVDLVVTSPPYLGMIDYALANRLTYLWMEWPIEADREGEIGSRRKRNHSQVESDYMLALEIGVKEIWRVLRKGGYCTIIIGSSRKFPHVARKVVELFSRYFHLVWGPKERTGSRQRLSPREGSESIELLCVHRKQEQL